MKKLLLILGLLSVQALWALEEPEAIDGKDLIELDNPEFEDEAVEIEMDEFMMDMSMPILDSSEETQPAKPEPVQEEAPKVEEKPAEKTQEVKEKTLKIRESTTVLNVNQLKTNDLIRVENGQIRVYRRVKGNIVRYKTRNGVHLASSGLEKRNDTNYYVRNTAQLVRDTKDFKEQKRKEEKLAEKQREDAEEAAEEAAEQATASASALSVDDSVRARRAAIEASQNNGKVIEKEILLKNLRTNDMVYVFDDIQLVVRKKKATSGYNQYWLMEAIDPNNPSLEKEGENKYKVLRSYRR